MVLTAATALDVSGLEALADLLARADRERDSADSMIIPLPVEVDGATLPFIYDGYGDHNCSPDGL